MKAGLIILSTLMTQPRSVWVKEKGVKTKKKKEKLVENSPWPHQ